MSFKRDSVLWFSGLYEGEGCLSYSTNHHALNGKSKSWKLMIRMTEKYDDVLPRLMETFDLGKTHKYVPKNPNWNKGFVWQVSDRDSIYAIVVAIYPFVGSARREKFDEFLTWYKTKPGKGKRNSL